jgi:hypothetical protein
LRVGARTDVVNAFVGPRPLRDGGVATRPTGDVQDFWASARRPVAAPANLWVHEYVHTRQNFTLGDRMAWFREASASYYASLLAVRQGVDGREGFEAFVERLHGDAAASATLADRSSWPTARTPYEKGQRVLAALDVRIRNATERNRTLQDVFRRLNAHDGSVEYEDFRAVVANVSGQSPDDWLDSHVAGPAGVDPPERPGAWSAPNRSSDADGDGLTERRERELGTHPFDADTDDDGLDDGNESRWLTDPTVADTDDDGLEDGREVAFDADPTVPDTDGDSLLDGREIEIGTDPTDDDTDGDGFADSTEVDAGSDPTDPYSTPATVDGTDAPFTDIADVLEPVYDPTRFRR